MKSIYSPSTRNRKFDLPQVKEELGKYGFVDGNYSKVIVTWGWQLEAKEVADKEGIHLWDFRDLVRQIADACRENRIYFTDDTARIIQLFARAVAYK